MSLSTTDKELVAKVRRSRDGWHRRRWVVLVASGACAAASIVAWFIQLPRLLAPETYADAMLWQSVLLVIAMGFSMTVGSVLSRWETLATDLLLRLVDSQDDKEAQPEGGANGSQPIRSETSSTSEAAGSRRSP